jgi:maltooligosyltrehalose synthase
VTATSGRVITITCVPRLIGSLISDAAAPPLGPAVWGDTRIELPQSLVDREEASSLCLRNVFTGAAIQPQVTTDILTIPAAALFDSFPVALLVPVAHHESSDPAYPPAR